MSERLFGYTYAASNRLIAVASGGNPVAAYVHNGRGERTSKTAGGAATYYVYDLSGSLIGEYYGSGATVREHAYGPAGRLASFDSTANTYWHHNDHLGTPQAMTDSAGTVVWTMSQTPFGIATVDEDPDGDGTAVTNNFRFPGQYYDTETGLNYNYFRTYDPYTGRYTQHDPIGLDGGMNPYGYVTWNPVGGIDPFGLRAITSGERKFLNEVFGSSVSYGSIDIKKGGVLTWTGNAVTMGNTIRFPSEGYSEDFSCENTNDRAWLVHEVTHVWQHQNIQGYHWSKALKEHIKYGSKVYDYVLDATKALVDYRFEQQGAIVEDYYRRKEVGQSTNLFEKVIYRSIKR